jgi:hypothetical protein
VTRERRSKIARDGRGYTLGCGEKEGRSGDTVSRTLTEWYLYLSSDKLKAVDEWVADARVRKTKGIGWMERLTEAARLKKHDDAPAEVDADGRGA